MTNIKISKAHKRDVPNLLQLEHTCFKTDRLTARDFNRQLNSDSIIALTAKSNSQLIGKMIVFLRRNSTIARLYSLAVLPKFQGKKVALTLLKKVEKKLQRIGINELRLEVRKDNRRALRFYRLNEFVKFSEYKKFYQDGMDAFRMRKALNNMKLK